MIRAKNYEIVSKFVKVMPRIQWPLFFLDTVYNVVCLTIQQQCKLCDTVLKYSNIMHVLIYLYFEVSASPES